MGKAISELDSYAGPMSGTTKLPVSDSDTLQAGTVSQVLTYIVANLGDASTKNVGTAAGTVAAGDHAHSGYAASGAIGSSGLTMATAKLLGRSTAGTGAPEEITLGTNLSFSGTTLNAEGGGGTPGGSSGQLQWNSSGSLAGVSGSVVDANGRINLASSGSAGVFACWSGNNYVGIVAQPTGHTNRAGLFNPAFGPLFVYDTDTGDTIANVSYSSGKMRLAVKSDNTVYIDNGTAGTYRDLKLRNLIGTGNLATGAVSKTADYTATTSDGTIEVDASGAARTITLFASSGNAGKILVIKKIDSSANAVTVDGNASETIDGATTISLASQYSTAILQVNAAGTGWNKLGGV